jgi:hypothetical protein
VIFHAAVSVPADPVQDRDDRTDVDLEACFLAHLACDRGVQILAGFDDPTRQAPLTFQRFPPALDQHHAIPVDDNGADAHDRTVGVTPHMSSRPAGFVQFTSSMRPRTATLPRGCVTAQLIACVAFVSLAAACVRAKPQATRAPATVDVAELWVEPHDIQQRDLYFGAGGRDKAPKHDDTYKVLAEDHKGYSPGYEAEGSDGRRWDVKLGPEAQPEVVASRILWAIGYHQPDVYYENWTTNEPTGPTKEGARFRLESRDAKVVSDWPWHENQFVTTRPFKGLVVANVILNSWDWKTSNNKVYEISRADGSLVRRYVVRDLGASLGKTSHPPLLKWLPIRGFGQGTRNDIDDFESQRFLENADESGIDFEYRGLYRELVDSVSAADVVWTCRLLSRLSDGQWRDAFRAAAYSDDVTERYLKKLKEKIAEGLALEHL